MITVVFEKDEDSIRKKIIDLLRKEGYIVPQASGAEVLPDASAGQGVAAGISEGRIAAWGDELFSQKKNDLYKTILRSIEKPLIEHVLERVEGNQLKAARILGINRNTMRSKIRKLGIDVSKWKAA